MYCNNIKMTFMMEMGVIYIQEVLVVIISGTCNNFLKSFILNIYNICFCLKLKGIILRKGRKFE